MNIFSAKFLNLFAFFLLFINLSFVNSQVSREWIHRYTGPESSTDSPKDFFIDDSGDIYITGKSIMGGGYSDIVTVKYNSNGVRKWIAEYNGLSNQNDDGIAISVDANDNVYVSGNTYSSDQYNFVTIKYNASGIQQWVQQYNGTGNFDDLVSSIAVDTSGNVYVGGSSYGINTSYDYVLIKYTAAGSFHWAQRWNGVSSSDDYLNKISLASNADIIVAGSSYNNNSSFNFTTLKYNSSGNLIWTKEYNGFSSSDDQLTNIKIDHENNIYICGKSVGTGARYDYATVKYNSSGNQQWAATYNSTFSSDDAATSVDVDLNGDVFVTGHSFRGTSFYDYTTIKYNSNGVVQWVRNYNGVENYFDKAFGVKTDDNGNAFVTGQSLKSSDGTGDFVTLKYNPSGDVQWTKTYDGPGQLDDLPVEMKIDKSGSIFIIGSSYSYFFSPFCGTSDYLILKYNSNSNFEWETRYDGAGSGIDEATSLTIDDKGNSYVTGFSFDNISNYDYATIKYNSAGAPQWAIRYDGG
ncbi:MAG: SBBP repeat-containing protein [Bacteroidota bacterium]|nr:SBBP repeat-containing protein [Bacteroidota bacterium]